MIWLDDTITEETKCPECILSESEPLRGMSNRGRGAPLRREQSRERNVGFRGGYRGRGARRPFT